MVERDYENAYKAHISRWGVGAALRGAREAGGETIAEAAAASRIRAEYIHALENEDYAAMPGWAHALSYVRTYADYLGLEPLPLVKRVREQIELRQHLAQPAAASRPASRWRRAAGIVIALGLVGAGGWYVASSAADITAMVERVPESLKAMIDRTFVTVADPDDAAPPARVAAKVSEGEDTPVEGETLALGVDAALPEPQPAGTTDADAVPIDRSSAARFAPLRETTGAPGDKIVIATHPRDAQDRTDPADTDIILRARNSVWLTVEDASGRSLLAEQIQEGALYRLPVGSGFTVTTDDAGAFEVYVEGALAGVMGPAGTSVTRLPVDQLTDRRADG